MSKEQYIALITQWAALHPGGLWQDTPEAAKARRWLRKNAPDTFSAIYYNEPDEYRTKIDRRFLPAGVEAKNFKEDVRKAINDTGTHIYNVLDKTTAWVPGPTGMVNWLGHVVADAAQGNVGNLAMHAGMAGLMGGAGRLAGKYLPKVASKIAANNPKFGTFMQKAGELADDLSWNRQRQDDAMAEWLANRDVRQRFNIGAVEPMPTMAAEGYGITELPFRSKFDGVPDRDAISHRLLDKWIVDNHPELGRDIAKARRADWGKLIMDSIDPVGNVPTQRIDALRNGLWNHIPFEYTPKPGVDEAAINNLVTRMSKNVPYQGNTHLPESLDITPFISLFDEPVQARDAAFELLQRAASRSKLSPKPVEVWSGPDSPDLPFVERIDRQPIAAQDLQKPILWFADKNLYKSGLSADNMGRKIASIGMHDMLNKNTVGKLEGPNKLYEDLIPVDVVGHEVGHIHPGFNTRANTAEYATGSPYYGNIYDNVNSSAKFNLTPSEAIGKELGNHDRELSEQFSDALGYRTLMSVYGINKGDKRPYSAADIMRLNNVLTQKYGEMPRLRFPAMHPTIEEQVGALNYGWAEGGKLR